MSLQTPLVHAEPSGDRRRPQASAGHHALHHWPQCNATQIFLEEDTLQDIYLNADTPYKTLFDYLAPLGKGEATIDTAIAPIPARENAFSTDLIQVFNHVTYFPVSIGGAQGLPSRFQIGPVAVCRDLNASSQAGCKIVREGY